MIYYLSLAFVLFVYMSAWFLVSLIKKRNDVADIAWGLGFILLAWTSFLLSGLNTARGILVCFLVTIWGIRLAFHIYSRNKGKKEDYRYMAWRKEWGKWFYLRSYFQVYLLQGLFLYIISFSFIQINKANNFSLNFLDAIGVLVWFFGFIFESIGDSQLKKFISNQSNKGKIIQSGLWQYTRHPNYFGEVTQWWGIWLIALSVSNSFIAIISPLLITFLILKVSGIPMLEKKMQDNLEFIEYKKKTSTFIPWFPKK